LIKIKFNNRGEYRSPYIELAAFKAQERARLAKILQRMKATVFEGHESFEPTKSSDKKSSKNKLEWNPDNRSSKYFDSNLKKVEIFEPAPTIHSSPLKLIDSLLNSTGRR
jgi:hypothetical protein